MSSQPHAAQFQVGSPRVWAVVPAAGYGRRIGQPKALLRLGDQMFVEHVVTNLSKGGVNGVVVVVNATIAEDVRTVLGSHTRMVVNDKPDAEMIESIQIGLAHWTTHERPDENDGCLVTPVDKPSITAGSVRRCVDAYRDAPDRIIIAARGSRRGHPIIFPWKLADLVQSLPPTKGLNQLPQLCRDRVLEVPCDDDAVLTDIDTPADYRKASQDKPTI